MRRRAGPPSGPPTPRSWAYQAGERLGSDRADPIARKRRCHVRGFPVLLIRRLPSQYRSPTPSGSSYQPAGGFVALPFIPPGASTPPQVRESRHADDPKNGPTFVWVRPASPQVWIDRSGPSSHAASGRWARSVRKPRHQPAFVRSTTSSPTALVWVRAERQPVVAPRLRPRRDGRSVP